MLHLVDGSSGNLDLETYMATVFEKAFQLWKRKQLHYSDQNIAAQGLAGISLKMTDKMARFRNYLDTGEELEDESIVDTWLDLCNYSAMCILVDHGFWPDYKGERYKLVPIEE